MTFRLVLRNGNLAQWISRHIVVERMLLLFIIKQTKRANTWFSIGEHFK